QQTLAFWQGLEPLLKNLPQDSNLELFGVTIRDPSQLGLLKELLQKETGGRCHMSVTTESGRGAPGFSATQSPGVSASQSPGVSASQSKGEMIGLIATARGSADALRQALAEQHVPEQKLPQELAALTLPQRIARLRQRLEGQREQCRQIEAILSDLAKEWRAIYRRAQIWLEEQLSLYRAGAAAYTTRLCFVIQGWMAEEGVVSLRDDLQSAFSGQVVLEQHALLEDDLDQAPVMLRNPGYFAPFEVLSRLLPLPKYSSYDPTPLIALFFPLLFGMILGDIGYGAILLLISLTLICRFDADRLPHNLGKVFGVAALYTILFGLLYGELLGDLGEHWLGLHPLWFDRGKAILPMAVFALSVGVAHIALGMALGALSELRRHQPYKALLKLLSLVAVLLLVLATVGYFYPQPWLAIKPLLIAVGLLLPVLIAAEGLLAPLELLKTVGNIISYVRIMAVGFSSVLLAMVANKLGGMTGDILVGILVAGLLHAFNLLLGVFAPSVHALRLHYVEFFSKFLDLGGRRFEPWQKRPS
ncbi:MAG: ATPase, partial [Desulfuromonadales bacterium]|nr:ATPase [Desulfuromonadales bacterium]